MHIDLRCCSCSPHDPTLLQKSFGLAARQTQWANLAATVAGAIFIVFIAAATDRFGTRRVAVLALVLMVGSTYLLHLGAGQQPALEDYG
jgi:nitrate/nitrite transporter NarK